MRKKVKTKRSFIKGAPASWVLDEAIWDEAKKEVSREDYPEDERYFSVVTRVYKNMKGRTKGGFKLSWENAYELFRQKFDLPDNDAVRREYHRLLKKYMSVDNFPVGLEIGWDTLGLFVFEGSIEGRRIKGGFKVKEFKRNFRKKYALYEEYIGVKVDLGTAIAEVIEYEEWRMGFWAVIVVGEYEGLCVGDELELTEQNILDYRIGKTVEGGFKGNFKKKSYGYSHSAPYAVDVYFGGGGLGEGSILDAREALAGSVETLKGAIVEMVVRGYAEYQIEGFVRDVGFGDFDIRNFMVEKGLKYNSQSRKGGFNMGRFRKKSYNPILEVIGDFMAETDSGDLVLIQDGDEIVITFEEGNEIYFVVSGISGATDEEYRADRIDIERNVVRY